MGTEGGAATGGGGGTGGSAATGGSVAIGGGAATGGGAAETVHHEVRTAVHRQLLEGKGKPSVLPYLCTYLAL